MKPGILCFMAQYRPYHIIDRRHNLCRNILLITMQKHSKLVKKLASNIYQRGAESRGAAGSTTTGDASDNGDTGSLVAAALVLEVAVAVSGAGS